MTTYRNADVDGYDVFYREAGSRSNPTLFLPNSFPTSSHQYRDLIPLLADHFHLIAPDLPGFGRSAPPPRDPFTYSFKNLAKIIDRVTEVVGLDRFALCVLDYACDRQSDGVLRANVQP